MSRFLLLLSMTCALLVAQAPTGIISGTVTVESGAVLPRVKATIPSKAEGFIRTMNTKAEGLYSPPALPAGDYQVRAELSGFRTLVRDAPCRRAKRPRSIWVCS